MGFTGGWGKILTVCQMLFEQLVSVKIFPIKIALNGIYRIAGFCHEDFNLTIGSIRDIKIRDHFIRDIL